MFTSQIARRVVFLTLFFLNSSQALIKVEALVAVDEAGDIFVIEDVAGVPHIKPVNDLSFLQSLRSRAPGHFHSLQGNVVLGAGTVHLSGPGGSHLLEDARSYSMGPALVDRAGVFYLTMREGWVLKLESLWKSGNAIPLRPPLRLQAMVNNPRGEGIVILETDGHLSTLSESKIIAGPRRLEPGHLRQIVTGPTAALRNRIVGVLGNRIVEIDPANNFTYRDIPALRFAFGENIDVFSTYNPEIISRVENLSSANAFRWACDGNTD